MKLLSPTEARDKARKSKEAENHRLTEIQALIVQKLKELAEVEKTFDEALQKQRNQWAAEEMEHKARTLELSKETEALEERKRQALLPLTEKAKELDTKASALDIREADLNLRESDLEDKERLLENRLDEVSEREVQADKVSRVLLAKEQGIQSQAAQVVTGSAALTVAIAKATAESAERERALELREVSLRAKEGNLETREKKVAQITADFDRREAVLKDERLALTAAAQELKQKYGIK